MYVIKLDGLYLVRIDNESVIMTTTQARAGRMTLDATTVLQNARKLLPQARAEKLRIVRLVERPEQRPGLSAALLALATEVEELPPAHPVRRAAGAVLGFF